MNLQQIFAETTQWIHHFDKYKCSPDKDSNVLTKSPLKPVQLWNQTKREIIGKFWDGETTLCHLYFISIWTSPDQSSECAAGCIAGIVIACFAIVAVACGVGYYFYRRR